MARINDESQIFGVSIRGWLALMIIGTVCYMSVMIKTVIEPLYSMSMLALGFYFGQATKKEKGAE